MIAFNERTLADGQRVDVYRNLRSQQLFSVKDRRSGLVVAHGTAFCLRHVKAVISKAGQVRARRENCRNVHGVLRGEFSPVQGIDVTKLREITYNPFHHDTFIFKDTGEVFEQATAVYFLNGKAWLLGVPTNTEA